MKIKQTIVINQGDARITVNRETDSDIDMPYPDEKLALYLDRLGIDVPLLRDILRIYTQTLRANEAGQLLELAGMEDLINAIQRGDKIEATEIFLSLLIQK